MNSYNFFFFAAGGVIIAAILGGVGITPFGTALLTTVLALSSLFIKQIRKPWFVVFVMFTLIGSVYYALDDYKYHKIRETVLVETNFTGIVSDIPNIRGESIAVRVNLTEPPIKAKILLRLNKYTPVAYGDVVSFGGSLEFPDGPYGNYLTKERIHGVAAFPEIEITGNKANPFFKTLYSLRLYIKEVFTRVFSPTQSALLTGIILGDKEEMPQELLDKLAISGTLHLTALSGSNMSIIIVIMAPLLAMVFRGRRRVAFSALFFMVALFVAMTGFEVSAVRAAFMAFIVGWARESAHVNLPRNAIALAALTLVLVNPKLPVFDLGFQLSFLALLGIIYLAPVLKNLKFFQESGAFMWREILAMTLSAQAAVAPIIIANFQTFSFSAIPANIAILAIMPFVMIFGFVVIILSVISMQFAYVFASLPAFLLDYIYKVMDVFYILRTPFNPQISVMTVAVYYLFLVWLCARFSPAAQKFFIPTTNK
ncbi:MAG: ComEC/Rec2 family competence protein [Candidatus Colwellbacteria bacterium]|nr:ComEC/Rec2 family competence protein [Candidatus Colwellbacteria bacterium]